MVAGKAGAGARAWPCGACGWDGRCGAPCDEEEEEEGICVVVCCTCAIMGGGRRVLAVEPVIGADPIAAPPAVPAWTAPPAPPCGTKARCADGCGCDPAADDGGGGTGSPWWPGPWVPEDTAPAPRLDAIEDACEEPEPEPEPEAEGGGPGNEGCRDPVELRFRAASTAVRRSRRSLADGSDRSE